MAAFTNSTQASVVQVSMAEIRRQLTEAVHAPAVTVPEEYSMNALARHNCPVPALALPVQGLQNLAQAMLVPAPAPNAKLLALKRKAQEWFG